MHIYTNADGKNVNVAHKYSGDSELYDITLTVTDGVLTLGYSSAYATPLIKNTAALRAAFCGIGVTGIAYAAFGYAYGLQYVTLGTELTTVSNLAFTQSAMVRSIVWPRTLTSVLKSASESWPGPRHYQFPATLTSAGTDLFRGRWEVSTGIIPMGVTPGAYAYYQTSLRALVGSGDMTGDTYVFTECYSAEEAYLAAGTVLGSCAFRNCRNLRRIVGWPYSLGGADAFYGCSRLEDLGQLIGDLPSYALYSCVSIRDLTLPDDCTSIGNLALYGMFGLTKLTVPASVTTIGSYFC